MMVAPSAASDKSSVSPAGTAMLFRTTLEHAEMLVEAYAASLKVQLLSRLVKAEARGGAAVAVEASTARLRTNECIFFKDGESQVLINRIANERMG